MRFRGSWSTFRWLTPLCALALPYVGLALLGLTSGCAKINRPWMDGGADSGIDAVNLDAPDRDSNGMDVLPDRVVDATGRDSELMDQDIVDLGVDTPVMDSGGTDIGVMDSGTDVGTMDSGTVDTGPADSGVVDSGVMDSGPMDSGPVFPPPDCSALGSGYSTSDMTVAGSTYRACIPNGVTEISALTAQQFCESAAGWGLVSTGTGEENTAVANLACSGDVAQCNLAFGETRVAVPLRVFGGRWYRSGGGGSACTGFFAFANANTQLTLAAIGSNSNLYTSLCGTSTRSNYCRCLDGAPGEIRSFGYWNFGDERPGYPHANSDTVALCLQDANPSGLICDAGQWANVRRGMEETLPYVVVCERQ